MRRAGPWMLVAVGALALLFWAPDRIEPPVLRPAASYRGALARLAALRSRDSLALTPGCNTSAWLTGRRSKRAFVLLHGITNCPLQFASLAGRLRDGGDNVVVPRVPYHGLRDRMTDQLARLEAEDLAALVIECAGIARGLGDTVVVAGLSTSGVAAIWGALTPGAADRVVALAPAFAPPWKPAWLAPLFTRLALRLPNAFVWWDDEAKAELPGPGQCYPRFATRAMGQVYRLGEDANRRLAAGASLPREVVLVTTAGDRAIDNVRVRALAVRARERGARVTLFEFAAADSVVHDMIDPSQIGERVDVVYPVLLRLLRGASPR